MLPIPTDDVVDSVPDNSVNPAVEIATIFVSPDASPTNFVAVRIPEDASILIDPTVSAVETFTVVKLDTPLIFALPNTSRISVGTVVPIPTKPDGLTIKLSLST